METLETRQKIIALDRMVDTFEGVSTHKPKVETKWKQMETKREDVIYMTRKEKQTLIEEVVEHICDEKCKMPDECSNDELDEICDDCPLNNLWDLQREE